MKEFLSKNKVLIMGSIAAASLAIYQFTSVPAIDWVLVGYTAFVAVGSYLARNLRGQWVTIIVGIILPVADVLYESHKAGGHVDLGRLLLFTMVQIGAGVAAPPKLLGYEQTPTILGAKIDGKTIQDLNLRGVIPTTIPPVVLNSVYTTTVPPSISWPKQPEVYNSTTFPPPKQS